MTANASAWAILELNSSEILVNTVCSRKIGAMVNWFAAHKRWFVLDSHSDVEIEASFATFENEVSAVKVIVTLDVQ